MRILSAASLTAVLSLGLAQVGLAQVGFAADLATKAPIYKAPPAPVATWTGCYVGGNVGYGWAPTKWTNAAGVQLSSATADGVVAGGQIGCDYQLNQQWVVGIRGMLDDGLKGSGSSSLNPAVTDTTNVPWFATVVGRIGYLFDPMTLLYAQGGGAWVHDKFSECCNVIINQVPDGYANTTIGGFTVGAGIEHKFTQNISAFIEYDYIGLGNNTVAFTGTGGFPNFSYQINQNVNLVLAGVNLRFNAWH